MPLAGCLLEAMDAYVSPSRIKAPTVWPTLDEMMNFCVGALHNESSLQAIGARSDLRSRAVGQP
jgi:hypothetical protein